MILQYLDFERPIVDLESRLEQLRRLDDGTNKTLREEAGKLEKKIVKIRKETFSNLTRWQITQLARHPNRPYMLDYVNHCFKNFLEIHGDRSFRDDPSIVAGFRGARLRKGDAHRPAEREEHHREDQPQLRDGAPGRVPEGAPADEARREIPYPRRHLHRHARRLPGARRRGTRPVRGDRPEPARDGETRDADRGRRDRRRGKRRRTGAGDRGRNPHDGIRDLLGHLSRGVRIHPVAGHGERGDGRGDDEDHRAGSQEVRHRGQDPAGAGRGGAPRPQGGRRYGPGGPAGIARIATVHSRPEASRPQVRQIPGDRPNQAEGGRFVR